MVLDDRKSSIIILFDTLPEWIFFLRACQYTKAWRHHWLFDMSFLHRESCQGEIIQNYTRIIGKTCPWTWEIFVRSWVMPIGSIHCLTTDFNPCGIWGSIFAGLDGWWGISVKTVPGSPKLVLGRGRLYCYSWIVLAFPGLSVDTLVFKHWNVHFRIQFSIDILILKIEAKKSE